MSDNRWNAHWLVLWPICLLPLGLGWTALASKAAIAATAVAMIVVGSTRSGFSLRASAAKLSLLALVSVGIGLFPLLIHGNMAEYGASVVDSQFYVYVVAFAVFFSNFGHGAGFDRRLLRAMDISIVVFFLDLLLVYLAAGSIFSTQTGTLRLSPSLGPSAGAMYLVPVFLLYVNEWLSRGSKARMLLTLVVGILIALTTTRIVLLGAAMSSVYLLWSKRKFGFNYKSLLLLIGAGVFGQALSSRLFFEGDVGSGLNTNGRFAVWAELIDAWLQSPFFGSGFGSSFSLMVHSELSAFGIQPHNDYLRILISTGAVGMLAFLALVRIMWRGQRRGNHTQEQKVSEGVARALIIALLVIMVTDNVLIYHFFLYPALLVIVRAAVGRHVSVTSLKASS